MRCYLFAFIALFDFAVNNIRPIPRLRNLLKKLDIEIHSQLKIMNEMSTKVIDNYLPMSSYHLTRFHINL